MAQRGVNEKHTSKSTGDKIGKVREAFHDARKAAREEGGWGVPSKGGSNGPPPKDGCYTDNYGSD